MRPFTQAKFLCWFSWTAILLLTAVSSAAYGRVTRFEIVTREPFADGQAFGDVGAYERIVGKVHFAIDPKLRQNEAIVDLQHAPRNKDGMVEFSSDLYILAPRDLSKASGAAMYGVNNRGRNLSLQFFNDAPRVNVPTTAEHAGNGFFFRHGWIVVWSGWDGELLPGDDLLRLYAPVARDGNKPFTGAVRYETFVKEPKTRVMMNAARDHHGAYRPTPYGLKNATLTWRLHPSDPRVPIPRDQFQLDIQDIEPVSPGQLPQIELVVPAGLKPGYIYEVIYEAQDPLVHGVCFAAVRDLMTSLKNGDGEDHPLLASGKPVVQRAHGFGVSQSGRFIREFIYSGFNEYEQGQQVFDGLMPHVAGGGLGSFNHRFAQPTAFNSQHELQDFCSDRFPFTYGDDQDPYTKKTDGILRQARKTKTEPLVMHTQSSAEYWTRAGSLPHTNAQSTKDAAVPDNVRFYSFGGTQHGPASWPLSRGEGQQLMNPGDYRPLLRALLLALDRWAKDGTPPPDSVCPKIADGTLVAFDAESTGFPSVPGVRYPEVILQPSYLNFGSRWPSERIMDVQPPRVEGAYRVLVPAVNADGIDRSCLLPPEVAVPLATFTGWNLRHRDAGAENALFSLMGSYIPFEQTKSQREKIGDPRLSLEERYKSLDDYRAQLKAQCAKMVREGYLLEEDVPTIVQRQVRIAAPQFDKQ